jgi:hypothetical protein
VAAYLCAVFQGALVSASSSLIYRRFAHFVGEVIPVTTLKLFSRLFAVLSPAVNKKIHQRVVGLARERGVSQGRKLRSDATVVESCVLPTASTLLGDGIRVLSRNLGHIVGNLLAVEVQRHSCDGLCFRGEGD